MTLDLKDAIDLCKNYSRSLLTCNIQSFNKNHFSINSLISDIEPTFISLQEIWSPKICMSLPDYHNPVMYTRTKKRVSEIFSPIEKISCKHIEKVVVKVIDSKCKIFLLISLYRPPKNKFFKDCLSELREVLEAAIKSNLPIILSGNLNIDLLQNDYFYLRAILNPYQAELFGRRIGWGEGFRPPHISAYSCPNGHPNSTKHGLK